MSNSFLAAERREMHVLRQIAPVVVSRIHQWVLSLTDRLHALVSQAYHSPVLAAVVVLANILSAVLVDTLHSLLHAMPLNKCGVWARSLQRWVIVYGMLQLFVLPVLAAGIILATGLQAIFFLLAVHIFMPPAQNPNSRIPASQAQIDALPVVRLSCPTSQSSYCTGCFICLVEFEDDDEVRRLPCRHDFHQGCIDMWLKRDRRCPLCMCPIHCSSVS